LIGTTFYTQAENLEKIIKKVIDAKDDYLMVEELESEDLRVYNEHTICWPFIQVQLPQTIPPLPPDILPKDLLNIVKEYALGFYYTYKEISEKDAMSYST
jgi:hypothetical protein